MVNEARMTPTSFLEVLSCGPLLCDGAMGTMLHSFGIGLDRCFDEMNLRDPDVVVRVHREYI